MSKSNIVLAILAGAVIGGIVAVVLTAENALEDEHTEEDEEQTTRTENIARQFSERLSSELKAAELKVRSAVKKDTDFNQPQGEFGVFL